MSDELKKKVARLFCDTAAGQCGDDFFCEQCLGGADEAIALVLEEAAKVADRYEIPMCETSASHIAAAIRALKASNAG
jgi:ethanolamine ammonia-lyase large subunit